MILRIWFWLISFVQVLALLDAVISFNGFVSSVWILVLLVSIAVTLFIYLEQPQKSEYVKLERTYAEFLKEKDKRIEELQQKNSVMFKTAVKRSETDVELAELKRKMQEKRE